MRNNNNNNYSISKKELCVYYANEFTEINIIHMKYSMLNSSGSMCMDRAWSLNRRVCHFLSLSIYSLTRIL